MCNALHIIADGMSIIVHGVDTPLVARSVVRAMQNTINHGVSEIHVRRSHIDFCTQTFFAVGIFPRFHFAEEAKIFFDAAVFIRAFFPGLRKRSARRADFFGRKIVYKRFSFENQAFGIFVNRIEKIGSVHFFRPIVTDPVNITADRVHKFRFFLGRIGIVEKQIAFSAVFFRRAEINEHALYVPDVQIPVRFGGKTSLNFRHFSAFDILVYDLFDKVRRFR